jgi:hypothetical protein
MKYFFKVLFLLLFSKVGFSQVERIPYYTNINFNNSFTTIAESDLKSNYYAVNLNVFSSPFEKAYFCDLCFKESKIVRLDAGNSSIAWFKSEKVNSEEGVNLILNNLKTQTVSMSNSMTAFQKQEWLNRNGK